MSFDKYALGEHLTSKHSLYTHHGLYLSHGYVIEYDRKNGVQVVSLEEFADGRSIEVIKHDKSLYQGEERVLRAISRLSENSYNVVFNNCEHFVNWCCEGISQSKQVQKVMNIAGIILTAIAEHNGKGHTKTIASIGEGSIELVASLIDKNISAYATKRAMEKNKDLKDDLSALRDSARKSLKVKEHRDKDRNKHKNQDLDIANENLKKDSLTSLQMTGTTVSKDLDLVHMQETKGREVIAKKLNKAKDGLVDSCVKLKDLGERGALKVGDVLNESLIDNEIGQSTQKVILKHTKNKSISKLGAASVNIGLGATTGLATTAISSTIIGASATVASIPLAPVIVSSALTIGGTYVGVKGAKIIKQKLDEKKKKKVEITESY